MDLKKERYKAAKKYGLEIQQELDEKIVREEIKHPPVNEMTKKEAMFSILANVKELFFRPFRKKKD